MSALRRATGRVLSTPYQKSLEIRTRLAETDPHNAEWQRNLSISHGRIGDVGIAEGDLRGALDAYQKSL